MATVEHTPRGAGATAGFPRSQVCVVVVLLAAAGAAWWVTTVRMTGMDAGPGADLGSLGWFTGAWTVMMTAMMLPSFAPTAAAYAGMRRRRAHRRWPLVALGYLVAWCVAGLGAYALFELGKDTLSGSWAWDGGGRWVAVGVLAVAAGYQLTSPKERCLLRCRNRRRFGVDPADGGPLDAVAAGIRAGVWCVGCSWALMAALFALGVMSLIWMSVIGAVVTFEKVGPWPRVATSAAAALLMLLAIGVLLTPHEIPGLVVPGASSAAHAMNAMG